MIGDTDLSVAMAYKMVPEGAGTTSDGRTAADSHPRRQQPCVLGGSFVG
jgi:hypothetical protein